MPLLERLVPWIEKIVTPPPPPPPPKVPWHGSEYSNKTKVSKTWRRQKKKKKLGFVLAFQNHISMLMFHHPWTWSSVAPSTPYRRFWRSVVANNTGSCLIRPWRVGPGRENILKYRLCLWLNPSWSYVCVLQRPVQHLPNCTHAPPKRYEAHTIHSNIRYACDRTLSRAESLMCATTMTLKCMLRHPSISAYSFHTSHSLRLTISSKSASVCTNLPMKPPGIELAKLQYDDRKLFQEK